MRDVVLVLTTLPDDERADALARALVDERMAACVSMAAPMTSIYRWEGAIEQSRERQLVLKTTGSLAQALAERIRALHPYELPEILVLNAQASDAYAAWVRAETGGRGDAGSR